MRLFLCVSHNADVISIVEAANRKEARLRLQTETNYGGGASITPLGNRGPIAFHLEFPDGQLRQLSKKR